MRARAIVVGADYWVREIVTPVRKCRGSRGFSGWRVRRRVTVVAKVQPGPRRDGVVIVEADRWVAANAHEFDNPAYAMVWGQLRYRRERHRWAVSVRAVVAPAEPVSAPAEDQVRAAA